MTNLKPIALVTGAATGIGRNAAVTLAKNGYDIVVNFSRSEDAAKLTVQQCESAGARTLLQRCDVSDDGGVRAMLAATEKQFGRLDVLINNAGTTVDVEPKDFDAMKVEDWNRVFNVNVLGLFLVTRAAAPLLKQSPNGCIVNTCSIAGLRPSAQPLPYAASKAAVANSDQDARQRPWPADPRQRRRAGLDRRRVDEEDAGGKLRRTDGAPREIHAAQPLLHGRRRRRQHAEPDSAQPLRDRRDHCRRRWICEHHLNCSGGSNRSISSIRSIPHLFPPPRRGGGRRRGPER